MKKRLLGLALLFLAGAHPVAAQTRTFAAREVTNTFTAGQIFNPADGTVGLQMQRATDTAPTGSFIKLFKADGTTVIFDWAIDGTMTTPILGGFTVAGLPAAGTAGRIAAVTDAATAGSCTSGGGSELALCRDSGAAWVALGDGGAGGGATTALDNLAAVALNTALLPDNPAASDFGSATLPFKDIFFAGGSGTPATNNFKLTGASTSGTRTIMSADGDSVTVISSSAPSDQFTTGISSGGVISYAQPAFSNLSGSIAIGQTPLTTRGDLLTVTTGPVLNRLAVGGANLYLKSNGTDTVYSTLAAGGVGACAANNFVTALNADAASTCAQPAVATLSDASNVVIKNASNTWSAGAQDFSGVTSLKIPVGAGASPTTNGFIAYDSTSHSLDFAINGVEAHGLYTTDPPPSENDCLKYSNSLGKVVSAGIACGGNQNFTASFTSQTSVTVTAAQHGFSSAAINVACYDDATPASWIEAGAITVDASTFEVVITFSVSTTGSCVLSGTTSVVSTPHNLLSTTHGDTTGATVQRADIVTGQGASAAWARLAKGTASQCVKMDGTATDVVWGDCGGGGSAPGGSGTELQYRFDATTFGGAAGTTWDNTNKKLTWAQGTLTTSNPFLNHTATWNDGAVTFQNIFTNITNTASAAASTLIDLQVGGASRFKVGVDGTATFGGTGTPLVNLVDGNLSSEIANANPGTTLNKLAKLNGAPSQATITATTDTGGAIGVVVAGAGTTGNAVIAVAGIAPCVFDGATTAGNYVQLSSANDGECDDVGATYPTTGQVVGKVLSTNGAAGTYDMVLFGPELKAGSRAVNKSVSWENPVTADSYKFMAMHESVAVTLTRVYCGVLGGTSATINLRKTSEATPFSGGTAALTSNLVCDTNGENSTTFTSAGVAANTPLMVEVTAVSGAVTNIIVGIHGTRD